MIDEISSAMKEEPGLSVPEAKRRLLEFGEIESERWHATIETWSDRVKHAAPFAAAGAAGLGFIFGRRRDKASKKRGSLLMWALRTAGPIAIDLLLKKQPKRKSDDQSSPAI